jgi:hypothetical protein
VLLKFTKWRRLVLFSKLNHKSPNNPQGYPNTNFSNAFIIHGGFLEGVYEIELDTKTEYEEF